MKVFEYVAFYKPTAQESKDGSKAVILIGPVTILAADDKAALLCAARAIPDTHADRLDQVEIAVRPF